MNRQLKKASEVIGTAQLWEQTISDSVSVYFNGSCHQEWSSTPEESRAIRERLHMAIQGDTILIVIDGGWYEASREYQKFDDGEWFKFRETFTPWFDAACDTEVLYEYVKPEPEFEPESVYAIAGCEAPMRQPIRRTHKLYYLGYQTHSPKKQRPKGGPKIVGVLSDTEGD